MLPASPSIYQLKITLLRVQPPIWRRVLVPASMTLDKLHRVIQWTMGWNDSHLHLFILNDQTYSLPAFGLAEEWEEEIGDERKLRLEVAAPVVGSCFVYEYDFGDYWQHEVRLEQILPFEAEGPYPVCLAGQRACPPDDCGGVDGYERLLEAIADPEHDEHEAMLMWLGRRFDPEVFAVDTVNSSLSRLRSRRKRG